MSIAQSVCAFVAYVIQHAMRMSHIANCGLPLSTKCFHIISNGTIFEIKKKAVIEH